MPLFVSFLIYGLASPFLPQVFRDKEIESVWTGVIFAVFSIASTFSSLLIGKFLDSIGHRNVLITATIQMAVSISLSGLIQNLEQELFVLVSIILRVAQGKLSVSAVQPGLPKTIHIYRFCFGLDRHSDLFLRFASVPRDAREEYCNPGGYTRRWRHAGAGLWLLRLPILRFSMDLHHFRHFDGTRHVDHRGRPANAERSASSKPQPEVTELQHRVLLTTPQKRSACVIARG